VRFLCTSALVLAIVCGPASAQTVPSPTVPDVPDEPLPEWTPPKKRAAVPLFLQLSPQMIEAQRLRQIGLWVSCIGWAQMFAAGIVDVAAAQVNHDLSTERVVGFDQGSLSPIYSTTFDPGLEDERNRLQNTSISLFSIGGIMAAGGFVVYSIGQSRISIWHKAHPKDPLPALSGF
jgi:hypothetical protein